MIINKKNMKMAVTDLLIAVTALIFAIGTRTWLRTCPVSQDMVMSCHWAGEMLSALSLATVILAAAHLFVPDAKIKIGVDLSLIALGILQALTPGNVIRICADTMMRCRGTTRPMAILFGVLIILFATADIVMYLMQNDRVKHSRNRKE